MGLHAPERDARGATSSVSWSPSHRNSIRIIVAKAEPIAHGLTRSSITGRAVQAVAASVAEANQWRAKASDSGLPFEIFFASVLRDALAKKPRKLRNKDAPTARGNVRGRVVQTVAATEEEADSWHTMAHDVGTSLEAFFAETLRSVLGQ